MLVEHKRKNILTSKVQEQINGLPIGPIMNQGYQVQGVQEIELNIDVLADFIDWTPFFKTWMLTGKYPAILQDQIVGEQATELWRTHKR